MNSLLQRLVAVYGAPNTPNPKRFFQEYSAATDESSDEVLALGGDILLRTVLHQGWPTIGECAKACSQAAYEISILQAKAEAKPVTWVEPSQESKDRVKALTADAGRKLAQFSEEQKTGEASVWKGRTYFGVTREDFEGRYSTVLGGRWHAPTLAEVIAKQDAKKHRDHE